MDALTVTYTNELKERIWDFQITAEGTLATIETKAETQQRATVASFLQRGTIPQLPNTGVQWAEFLTGSILPAELNSQILENIHELADTYSYTPKYTTKDGRLYVNIEETSL